jgi:hypothetical protein
MRLTGIVAAFRAANARTCPMPHSWSPACRGTSSGRLGTATGVCRVGSRRLLRPARRFCPLSLWRWDGLPVVDSTRFRQQSVPHRAGGRCVRLPGRSWASVRASGRSRGWPGRSRGRQGLPTPRWHGLGAESTPAGRATDDRNVHGDRRLGWAGAAFSSLPPARVSARNLTRPRQPICCRDAARPGSTGNECRSFAFSRTVTILKKSSAFIRKRYWSWTHEEHEEDEEEVSTRTACS